MTKLLAQVMRWLGHKLAVLVWVLLILLAGSWLRGEWKRLSADKEAIALAEQRLEELRTQGDALAEKATQLRRSMEQEVWEELTRLDEEVRKLEELNSILFDRERQRVITKQARENLVKAERRVQDLKRKMGLVQDAFSMFFIRQHLELKTAEAEAVSLRVALASSEKIEAGLNERYEASPLPEYLAERERLNAELEALEAGQAPELQAIEREKEQKQQDMLGVLRELNQEKQRAAQDVGHRVWNAVMDQLPVALWIMVGVMLAPLGIKGILFYGIAPLASRMRPVQVGPGASLLPEVGNASAVSVSVEVGADEEILVHADFLQSSPTTARKHTRWFLNKRIPFSSIASGMVMLTRVRPRGEGESCRVVVSCQKDPLAELGIIRLPEGSSMVLQPRALAGVVTAADQPVRVTRHWRLFHLQAWLTLQLRYLVFHGPCTLIVKGARGVRSEMPEPEHPRMINQAATIGFTTNLACRNTRCETFIAYLRGKEDLFNDQFEGRNGLFIYEEMPAAGRRTGLTGRGLEGLTDALLKVFGV
jgi:hypothetical protein